MKIAFRSFICLQLLLLFAGIFTPAIHQVQAEEKQADQSLAHFSQQLTIDVPHAMAIDAESGQILYQKEADQLAGIASITKLLSLYVVYDAIAAGKLSLDTKIPVSVDVAALAREEGYANVPLEESTDLYRAEDLINATIVGSANAAIVALAEYIAGSEKDFVSMMKNKLVELGISEYDLYTASGMSANHLVGDNAPQYSEDLENRMRARDVLFMARELIADYPELQDRSQQAKIDFPLNEEENYPIVNANKYVASSPYHREDVYGLKTGTEKQTGSCILVITEIAGQPVYAITLGAATDQLRYQETNRLLDYLNTQLQYVELQGAGETAPGGETVDASQGKQDTTSLVFDHTLAIFLPKDYNRSSIKTVYSHAWQYNAQGQIVLNAPLEESEPVNTVKVGVDFYQSLFSDNQLKNSIHPSQDVGRINLFVYVSRLMADMFDSWGDQLFG